MLRGEVATYDQFIRGEVYGWYVDDEDGNLYSCWGYFDLESVKYDITNRLPKLIERSNMGAESQE